MKTYINVITLATAFFVINACQSKKEDSSTQSSNELTMEELVDSLYYFDKNRMETDLLSRHLPDLNEEDAYKIQRALKQKYIDKGSKIIGYKMGGTVSEDASGFKPLYGIILDKDEYKANSTIKLSNFPGNDIMVEAEVGFIIKNDLKNGVESIEDLKASIESVISGMEFAKSIAIPINGDATTLSSSHIIAGGVGHSGIIKGTGTENIDEFDFMNETTACYINDSLAAEGTSSVIYKSPINALFWLANKLPETGHFLKKGDVIVTGSTYTNPLVSETGKVRLEFSSLGNISFELVKD